MAEVKWIKVATDMFRRSRKIKSIELKADGDTIIVIWLKLMLLAGDINDGGAIYITPEIPYDTEELAEELRRPTKLVEKALATFERFGMISIEDGFIYLTSWEKYQNVDGLDKIREQNRIRKQRQRAKQGNVNSMSRDGHVTVTPSHATEEEVEEDEEKEFHSFIHAPTKEEVKRKFLGGELGKGVVLLSDEQMDDLLNQLSLDEFNKYVTIVADMELSGKRYRKKTHYKAILDMAYKDRQLR